MEATACSILCLNSMTSFTFCMYPVLAVAPQEEIHRRNVRGTRRPSNGTAPADPSVTEFLIEEYDSLASGCSVSLDL
jgi:hypothetical protein